LIGELCLQTCWTHMEWPCYRSGRDPTDPLPGGASMVFKMVFLPFQKALRAPLVPLVFCL
jgi:hypothetical protein